MIISLITTPSLNLFYPHVFGRWVSSFHLPAVCLGLLITAEWAVNDAFMITLSVGWALFDLSVSDLQSVCSLSFFFFFFCSVKQEVLTAAWTFTLIGFQWGLQLQQFKQPRRWKVTRPNLPLNLEGLHDGLVPIKEERRDRKNVCILLLQNKSKYCRCFPISLYLSAAVSCWCNINEVKPTSAWKEGNLKTNDAENHQQDF